MDAGNVRFRNRYHDLTQVFADPGRRIRAHGAAADHVSGRRRRVRVPARTERLRQVDHPQPHCRIFSAHQRQSPGVWKRSRRGPAPERGVCFQEAALFPWLRVLDNVLFGPQAQGRRSNIAKEAVELLRRVGLEEFQNHYPHQLSGGMKQRVAIARLLINDPQILLMDEPFGALDVLTRLQIQEYLSTIHQEFRRTVVFVTHDVDEAVYTSDRILMMSARPGRIVQEIAISEPRPRRREFVTTPQFLEYKRQALAVIWRDQPPD